MAGFCVEFPCFHGIFPSGVCKLSSVRLPSIISIENYSFASFGHPKTSLSHILLLIDPLIRNGISSTQNISLFNTHLVEDKADSIKLCFCVSCLHYAFNCITYCKCSMHSLQQQRESVVHGWNIDSAVELLKFNKLFKGTVISFLFLFCSFLDLREKLIESELKHKTNDTDKKYRVET